MAALYLQVSIVSQALIFVTRSRGWSYAERPGLLLLGAFAIAQLVRKIVPFIPFMKYRISRLVKYNSEVSYNKLTDYIWCSQSGCNSHSCIRQLGLCNDKRNGLGMGWSHLALQYHLLYSTWHYKVCHPLHLKWEGLDEHDGKQGLVSFMFLKVELCI